MDELNLRTQSFDYGFIKRKNRPVVVNLGGESNDLRLNAFQLCCLLKNVAFMIVYLVTLATLGTAIFITTLYFLQWYLKVFVYILNI